MPNQTDPNQGISVQHTDLPPLPDYMNVPATNDSSGSAAPSDLPPVTAPPKKKFGGGKIIATILGLVLLVGGVGAGVVLTQQQQLFQQKATGNCSSDCTTTLAGSSCPSDRACDGGLVSGSGGNVRYCCKPITTPTKKYKCSGSSCVEDDANGSYTSSNCDNTCGGGGSSCSFGGNNCSTTNCCQDSSMECKSIPSDPSLGKRCELKSCDCDPTTDTTAVACNIDNKSGKKKCVAKAGTTTGHCGGWGPCTPDGSINCSGIGGTCQKACAATGQIENDTADCQADGGKVCCRPTGGGGGGGGVDCGKVGCGASGCSADTTGCYVNHYWCKEAHVSGGCSDTLLQSQVSSAVFNQTCGMEQIDIYCPACGYPTSKPPAAPKLGTDYQSKIYASNCGGETPTPPPTAPMCIAVTAYDPSWSALSSTQLSALSAGSQVNFCVSGSAPSGTFDKAQFTINGVQQAETTAVRPGSTDFCQNYTILSTDTTVGVTAKIHHSTLGWY